MSRAFVKEQDDPGPDEAAERPLSPHPNYVTAAGLEQLRQRLRNTQNELALLSPATLEAASRRVDLERELRWLQARLDSAIPMTIVSDAAPAEVAFGTWVELSDIETGETSRYRIVGEDEADPEHGKVSWMSPLAQALLGAEGIRRWRYCGLYRGGHLIQWSSSEETEADTPGPEACREHLVKLAAIPQIAQYVLQHWCAHNQA